MSRELSNQAELIKTVVSNFGCLSITQAEKMLGGGDMAKKHISFLILKNYLRTNEKVMYPAHNAKIDSLMLDCLWVAISRATDKDGNFDSESLMQAFQNSPVQVSMIYKNVFYNIVGITDGNAGSVIPFLIDRFRKSNPSGKKDGIEYVFVVRSEDVIDQILEFEIDLPYRIALITGDNTETPKVKYLKKN